MFHSDYVLIAAIIGGWVVVGVVLLTEYYNIKKGL